ncbi:MAG: mechanosensitive ion channel family protein [Armatimonadetes bacterium]|nr:mechanosensitive ion channel family protein [Armatimonadota bacterium]
MPVLEWTWYGNTAQQWLLALAVAGVVAVGLRVVKKIVADRLAARATRTGTDLDNLASDLAARTRRFFILVIALYAGSLVLALPAAAARVRDLAAAAAVLVQLALWGNGLITFGVSRYMQRRLEQDAASATTIAVLGFAARLLLWTVALLLALDNFGIDVTALVAGLGVGGIAVALALQNILGDLFAAFSIALDKPFNIGDFIVVDDFLGTVEHIGLKTTRVRSLSGEQVIFSNGDLLRSRIRNYKQMYERRVVFGFGVTYETPPEKLAAIPALVRRIVEAQPQARFDRAHFKAYGDYSLNFEVAYYVLTPTYNTYMDIQQIINLEIYRQFQAEGIEFAYPTQILYHRGPTPAGLPQQ